MITKSEGPFRVTGVIEADGSTTPIAGIRLGAAPVPAAAMMTLDAGDWRDRLLKDVEIIKAALARLDPPEWKGPDMRVADAAVGRLEAALRPPVPLCANCQRPLPAHADADRLGRPVCPDGRLFDEAIPREGRLVREICHRQADQVCDRLAPEALQEVLSVESNWHFKLADGPAPQAAADAGWKLVAQPEEKKP